MEELKCPFCGFESETFYFGRTEWDDTRQFVGCDNCIKSKEYYEVSTEDLER